MLTLIEKVLFVVAVLTSGYFIYLAARRIVGTLSRGKGRPDWKLAQKRLVSVLVKVGTLQPTFKIRLISSLLHALVAWGFIY